MATKFSEANFDPSVLGGNKMFSFAAGTLELAQNDVLLIKVASGRTWSPGTLIFSAASGFTVEYSCSNDEAYLDDKTNDFANTAMMFVAAASVSKMMPVTSKVTVIRITNTGSTPLRADWVV